MKHYLAHTVAAGLTAVFALASVGCGAGDPKVSASTPASGDAVKRGEYLVSVVGCNDCHTPLKMGPQGPEPDMTRFLSGHPEQVGPLPAAQAQGAWLWAGAATNTAFTGPWGVSYAANLTPDRNTGLGIWDEKMFLTAIRTGRHMGTSRPIMPPMPWPAFRNASDDDLKAIYAYLRSIKPITNHVPDVQPAAAPTATN
jgi:mono/diheme cytochrome c family protein